MAPVFVTSCLPFVSTMAVDKLSTDCQACFVPVDSSQLISVNKCSCGQAVYCDRDCLQRDKGSIRNDAAKSIKMIALPPFC